MSREGVNRQEGRKHVGGWLGLRELSSERETVKMVRVRLGKAGGGRRAIYLSRSSGCSSFASTVIMLIW